MEMWEKIQKMLKQNQQKNNWMIEIEGKNEVEMIPRLLLKNGQVDLGVFYLHL